MRVLAALSLVLAALAYFVLVTPSKPSTQCTQGEILFPPAPEENADSTVLEAIEGESSDALERQTVSTRTPATIDANPRFLELDALVICPEGRDCGKSTVYASLRKSQNRVPREAVTFDGKTDTSGRAHVKLPKSKDAATVVLWAESDDESFASQPQVLAEADGIPAQVTLVLEPKIELRVSVLHADGSAARGSQLNVSRVDGLPYDELSGVPTDEHGDVTLRLPHGRYELVASELATQAVARTVLVVRDAGRVELRFPFVPLAVAGVVLDENGNGLASVALAANVQQARVGALGYLGPHDRLSSEFGVGLTTDAEGRFEARFARCGDIDITVSFDPFLASFAPPSVRVPHGTTDLVIRRERSWDSIPIRVHVVDAASMENVRNPKLSMRVASSEGQRIFQGHDGWIEARVPQREGLTWTVDDFGHLPVEGSLADLHSRVHGGTVEVALLRDSSEVAPPETKRALDSAPLPKPKDLKRP